VPVPVSVTRPGLSPASLRTSSFVSRIPSALGANLTSTVHDEPTETLSPVQESPVTMKSFLSPVVVVTRLTRSRA
jgi:hypothetical protein